MKVAKFIKLSRWFNRKSQHYILGNWTIYIPWGKKLFNYYKRYPIAWIKFMWYVRTDWKGGEDARTGTS